MSPNTSFSDLKSLSQKLNQASDKLNGIIDAVEAEIGSLNLGVEAWVPVALSSGHSERVGTEYLNEVSRFGWSKYKGKWQLVVRRELQRSGFWEGDTDCPYTNIDKIEYVPLKETSREERATAISQFDELKKQLQAEMERVIAVVEPKNDEVGF